MKMRNLNGAFAGVLACCAFISFAGCDTGSSAVTPTVVQPIEDLTTVNLDFEAANIASIVNAGGFVPEVGDVRATWGDSATFGKATSDMSFGSDATVFSSGSASLKVTATVLQNHYSATVAQWCFRVDLSKTSLSQPMDLTGKTASIKAYIPAASALSAVKLVFVDSTGKKSQGKELAITAKDSWATVTYAYVDGGAATSDYTDTGFDVTKVTAICVVAIKNGATAASSETLYVDNLEL